MGSTGSMGLNGKMSGSSGFRGLNGSNGPILGVSIGSSEEPVARKQNHHTYTMSWIYIKQQYMELTGSILNLTIVIGRVNIGGINVGWY